MLLGPSFQLSSGCQVTATVAWRPRHFPAGQAGSIIAQLYFSGKPNKRTLQASRRFQLFHRFSGFSNVDSFSGYNGFSGSTVSRF